MVTPPYETHRRFVLDLKKQLNMKKTFLFKNIPLLIIGSGLVLSVAFAKTTGSQQKHTGNDTVPEKQKKIRDLDEALTEIDRGEQEMQRALKEMDRDKMDSEI